MQKYTDEELALLKELQTKETSVEDMATILGRTTRSVISKLSSLGLYKRKPYVDKSGNIPLKKEEMVELIALRLNKPVEMVESLEKCTKYTLKALLDALDKK